MTVRASGAVEPRRFTRSASSLGRMRNGQVEAVIRVFDPQMPAFMDPKASGAVTPETPKHGCSDDGKPTRKAAPESMVRAPRLRTHVSLWAMDLNSESSPTVIGARRGGHRESSVAPPCAQPCRPELQLIPGESLDVLLE